MTNPPEWPSAPEPSAPEPREHEDERAATGMPGPYAAPAHPQQRQQHPGSPAHAQPGPYAQPGHPAYGQPGPYAQPGHPAYGQPGPYPQPGLYGRPLAVRPALREQDLLDARGRRIWRLPAAPVEYQHMLRGRGYAWWKPIVSMLVVLALVFVPQLIFGLLLGIVLFASMTPDQMSDPQFFDDLANIDFNNPLVMVISLVSLALLIPGTMLAVRWVHGVKGGYLSSVTGRFRWRWALACAAVALPVWVVAVGLQMWLDGASLDSLSPPENWPLLVAIIVLLVPLQAAGEEYAFRGYLTQAVGSWFAHRWLALVVPSVISVALFALAHGSLNPWILLDLALFAAVAVYLTWRTGGLEAAVAVHTVNNVVVFLLTMVSGDLNAGLVGEETTQDPSALGYSVAMFAIVLVALTLLARRMNIQRRFEPVPVPPPAHHPLQGQMPAPMPPVPAGGPTAGPQASQPYQPERPNQR